MEELSEKAKVYEEMLMQLAGVDENTEEYDKLYHRLREVACGLHTRELLAVRKNVILRKIAEREAAEG